MKINSRLYQSLGPQDRAIALFAAVNRGDHTEMDRLMKGQSGNAALNKAIRGLGLALESYNMLINRAIIGYLNADRYREKADAFCMGWRSAGGSDESPVFKQFELNGQVLSSACDQWATEITDTQLVAQEWCTKNQIPTSFFSGSLCPCPLPQEIKGAPDSNNCQDLLAVFDKITLF